MRRNINKNKGNPPSCSFSQVFALFANIYKKFVLNLKIINPKDALIAIAPGYGGTGFISESLIGKEKGLG
jgi:hypothetical protein